MAGEAYDNAMFGMADPNMGPTSGGKLMKSISDADTGLQKLLGTLGKIERKLDNISKKASGLSNAFGGSPSGTSNKNGRQSPSFPQSPTAPGGTRFIPGLDNDSNVGQVPASMKNGKQTPRFGTVGLAFAEAGVQSVLQGQPGLYDQDRLYTSMRLGTLGMTRGGQNDLARSFAAGYKGSYTSQADLQQAQYVLRSMGVTPQQQMSKSFMQGNAAYSRMSNAASLSDSAGQMASLLNPATQNLLRAYGIPVRGRNQKQIMDQVFNQVFSRVGGSPSEDQINTTMQAGGNGYQTAINLGIDPAEFADFARAKVNPNKKIIDQSVPGTSKNRAGSVNTFTQEGYGSRVATTNLVNNAIGKISDNVDKYLPYLANLGGIGSGLGALAGNPAGGSNILGGTINGLIEGAILKNLLGKGGAGAASKAGLLSRMGLAGGAMSLLGGGIAGLIGGEAGAAGGRHIGGKKHRMAGSVAGGAAGGALTGAALGAVGGLGIFDELTIPAGALIGGAVGGISGFLSGQSGGPDSKKLGTAGNGGGQTYGLLEQMAAGLGGGYGVTSTTGGKHANGSLHYLGEAIDLGSRPTPGDPGGLLKIDRYFASKYGPHLSELIYGGPGGINIKNGKVLSPAEALQVYGPETLAEHRNHVHVGATPDMLRGAGAPGGSGGTAAATGSTGGGGGSAAASTLGSAALALAEHVRSMYTVGGPQALRPIQGVGAGGGGTVSTTGAPESVTGSAALGKKMAAARGWTGKQWDALYSLWNKESGWRNTAQNDHSTAFGIAQFLDSTWAGTGYKKTTDPSTQIAAGLAYIASRYGDPEKAWAHSQANNWYSKGAWRIANDKSANVHEGEMILPSRIAEAVRGEMGRGMNSTTLGGSRANVTINLTVQRATDAEAERFAKRVKHILAEDDEMNKIAGGG